ncbi:MAG: lytic murein transglycosylase [Hydrotalea sp.]|nr:lytic murein transglycosylase [Hydrotalea sp.]
MKKKFTILLSTGLRCNRLLAMVVVGAVAMLPSARLFADNKNPAASQAVTKQQQKKSSKSTAQPAPKNDSTTGNVAAPSSTPAKPAAGDNAAPSPSQGSGNDASKDATKDAGNDAAKDAAGFADFLKTVAVRAKTEGVQPATINNYLLILKKPLASSIAKDRAQGEFILSFRTYYSRTVTAERIATAKQYAIKYGDIFDAVEKKYGVPREVILAFWSLESTFGQNMGRTPAILSLATLAYEGRRREFFTSELIAALKIIDQNHFQSFFVKAGFLSSWAGALGQVQFMPSTYLKYAVDGDGNGVRDLWNNPADIIFSTANFVSQLGWNEKDSWGQVVTVPSNFLYRDINDKNKRSFHYWRSLGVRDLNGNLISDHFFYQGTILVPMSAQGPIFLVEDNFFVIKKWNNSNFFALSIGLLADSIAGNASAQLTINPNIPDWQTDDVIAMQYALQQLGLLDKNKMPDGVIGPDTRQAIQQYQDSHGMVADGYPSRDFFTVLRNDAALQP